MTSSPLITLTTDFGDEGGYVAQMKGVIAGLCPSATVIDISHHVPPQDIAAAAWLLRDVVEAFPPHAIHVAVVDPGVGSRRSIVAAETAAGIFVAPDNGVLTLILEDFSPRQLVRLTAKRFWRASVSATFHGRDIMSPVAAHLALGTPLSDLGEPLSQPERLPLPSVSVSAASVAGSIVRIDHYGNLISNIRDGDCPAESPHTVSLSTRSQTHQARWVRWYAEGRSGETVALFGSSRRLEIAVVNGSAATALRAHRGDRVEACWEA